jgi:hypothetical protein
VFERLKKLFAPRRRGPEVEYERVSPKEQSATYAGPPTSGVPPAAPLDPPVTEESDPKS